jgi:3-hydroxybutyryl-CoA dehydrogenase
MTPSKGISSVGVIGSGTMGQGIAQACAAAGYPVILFDIRPELNTAALGHIQRNLEVLVEKGKLTTDSKHNYITRIRTTTTLAEVVADLIIEAVVENINVKRDIFNELERVNSQDAILVSNTSSLSINAIGLNLKNKARFAGLHFFNPAPVMKLVEVVRGESTDVAVIDALRSFCESLQKQSVIVRDSPGFIVNRVARLYYVEALRLVEEGAANFSSIDLLMRNAGFKMGPFELMDLIGIDTNLAVTKSIYQAFGNDPKFRPSPIQQEKVDLHQLGRKTGKGFYDYSS